MAQLTSQQKKIILVVVFVLIFIVILSLFRKRAPKPVSLEVWGIYDDPQAWAQIIYEFNKVYPHISVRYTQKEVNNYEEELLKAFAENKAPDIFMVLGEWIPRYQNKITPLNLAKSKEINLKYLQDNYPEVVLKELVSGNYLLAAPLSVDTLALYYNKDIFNYFNIPLPPKTWEEIIELIPRLRQVDLNGNLTRGAIALGTANNVNWFSDILSALMMQKGSPIINSNAPLFNFDNRKGIEALTFYTQFADFKNKNYTWNEYKINSIAAFARGFTVMTIGYERVYNYIKSQNPQLNFGITQFPQFKDSPLKINYASTINLIVNKRISYDKKVAAWTFLKFLMQPQISETYFLLTGHPPARRDLIAKYLNDPVRGVFVSQILTSQSYYQFNSEQIKEVFKEMVTQVNRKKLSPSEAINTAVNKLNYLWYQSLKKS